MQIQKTDQLLANQDNERKQTKSWHFSHTTPPKQSAHEFTSLVKPHLPAHVLVPGCQRLGVVELVDELVKHHTSLTETHY